MKRIVLFVLGLFAGISTKAQTSVYHPFHGNYTNYGYHTLVWNGSEINDLYEKTVWGEDTLIGGENYIQIYMDGIYKGGVRENAVNQQRFFIDLNDQEHDISISHFLSVGDTLSDSAVFLNAFRTYFDAGTNYNMFDSIIVAQVDSILEQDGMYSKTYFFENPEGFNVFIFNTYRGLQNFDILENHTGQFCYRELDPANPPNPVTTFCDLGIDVENTQNISLYPNPATESIRLLNTDLVNIRDAAIYDLRGNKIQEVKLTELSSEVSVKNLKDGIYFLVLNQNTQVLRFQKR